MRQGAALSDQPQGRRHRSQSDRRRHRHPSRSFRNPAVEDQATDRAHRIGQDTPVFVYKLVAQGTVEERMLELQQRKKALAAGIYEAGGSAAASLDAADIERLFEPLG